ncbi:MAG TPA: glycosyltransferase family A protein [Isosphaeraceae bacterium]|jgi:GT2 family glycosyltransferase|nr:glycosyltransferase family A protein [Isosphaeraceae bacterium]
MDDFPAGPACPGPRRPPLSVVVPVRDGSAALRRCLRGLRDSGRADVELIVVDDGSTDDSAAVAAGFGAVVLRHPRPLGPAAARNAGARVATAPLVFFLDADVVLHPDAIEKALARFDADPGLVALFGSYDDAPDAPGLVSRFRNLLHHFTHQQGTFCDDARPVHTFWTGCGAIRRAVFLDHGGFDPLLYRRPAIEDIELGYRLTRDGHRIVLARDVQATHLKRWTLAEVVRTDIFRRGVPWTLLMLRSGVAEADLNVSRSQRLCVALTGVTLLAIVAAIWSPWLLAVAASSVAANVALNRQFFRFLAQKGGWRLAMAAVPLHQVYYLCCGVSVLLAMAIWLAQGRPMARPVVPAPRLVERATAALPRPNSTRPRRPTRWTGK